MILLVFIAQNKFLDQKWVKMAFKKLIISVITFHSFILVILYFGSTNLLLFVFQLFLPQISCLKGINQPFL